MTFGKKCHAVQELITRGLAGWTNHSFNRRRHCNSLGFLQTEVGRLFVFRLSAQLQTFSLRRVDAVVRKLTNIPYKRRTWEPWRLSAAETQAFSFECQEKPNNQPNVSLQPVYSPASAASVNAAAAARWGAQRSEPKGSFKRRGSGWEETSSDLGWNGLTWRHRRTRAVSLLWPNGSDQGAKLTGWDGSIQQLQPLRFIHVLW